jgi:small-conductance mechanosensitive channel
MFGFKKFTNSLPFNKVKNHFNSIVSKKNSNSILHNRVLLYALLILALLDLFYLANSRDFTSVTIFILIALLTSFFCKNMIVILFVSICITHILKYPRSLEGAKNMDDEEHEQEKEHMENEDNEDDKKEHMDNEEHEDEKKEHMENKKNPADMTNEMKEFVEVQNKIIGGMAELEPLMQKAEGFIEKFEKYSKY